MYKPGDRNTPPVLGIAIILVVGMGLPSSLLATESLALAEAGPKAAEPAENALAADVPGQLTLAQAESPEPSGSAPVTTADPEPVVERTDLQTIETVEVPSCPLSLGLSYALYSDYIFRGINFSEYAGEAREKLNHQLTVSLGYDLGEFGSIGFDTWFEWFAGQKKIDPDRGGQNLQEVDYVIYWAYGLEPIATDLTIGYSFYQFVNLAHGLRQDGARGNNNDDRTHEYWFSLEHNDAWMWQWLFPNNEDGVLTPSFFFAHDVGAIGGVWMEFGLSHDFSIPGVDHLTITPGCTLLAQCDYWKDGMFLAGDQWSLVAEYDLTPLLGLPEWAGCVSITGELYFFNAVGNFEGSDFNGQARGQDEFWGGMTVNWAWGG